jgi:hypothetical protein
MILPAIYLSAGNGDFGQSGAIWSDFGVVERPGGVGGGAKVSKKRDHSADPREARERARNGAIWGENGRKRG